ncbi:unnamed protein product [Cladocopium goreaui]|uniref:Vacuolar protein sorting-associated protein 13B n=1 Tax=Cladocopium goreaui TaxID=2562237 RepID=A0A9P1CXC0_9DINO|nr:unnamed protein product [Cladocopium goreaui]
MLETVLTRIILRYAQRFLAPHGYICDTLRTDSLSLWGGDLRVQNFELRSDELAKALGTEGGGLRLTRGFVRELRVVVPWNAIRSQSLRIEVDAVEVIFCSERGRDADQPATPVTGPPGGLPSKESSQESLEETQETWLQPLLRNIFGNLTVSVDNLVAKLIRNGAVACVTLERLDSRPQSPSWEAAFTPLTSQPLLYRVVSVRDATMTLDVQGERQKAQSRRPRAVKAAVRNQRQVALPILHRVSAEAVRFWFTTVRRKSVLQWKRAQIAMHADAPPTSRLGLHLSPIRARLGSDQVQVLAQLLGPEVDSESDRFSLMSGGGS